MTRKYLEELVFELLSNKLSLDFFIGVPKNKLSNIAFLYEDKKENKTSVEYNGFNNPEHKISFIIMKIGKLLRFFL
jgi:hypothetical protein